jgi:hypothetical protein
MLSDQWKWRKLMVEANTELPSVLAMTLLAACAELTSVLVIFLVTRETICRQLFL